ncbi:T9SS type A sorting domain-containing protein, partial [bacterium]|nr:T9SS type A sorting domain-containing protein [bacterium]
LGGDDYSVPVRYGSPHGESPGVNNNIPCDMYFSDLTGNWNCDTNAYWGEVDADSADRFPEVFVGRITAYNTTEVQNWVTKALHYEKTPGVIFDTILWVRQEAIDTDSIPSIFPPHISHIIAQDYYANDALDIIDRGYAYVNIHCHGDPDLIMVRGGCCLKSWWPDTNETYSGLNWLTNFNKYFVIYSMACAVGAFDNLHPLHTDTCIADAFVDAYLYNQQGNPGPYGACAFLGNTRTGVIPIWRDLENEFYNRVFCNISSPGGTEPSITRISVAEALSKCGVSIDWENELYRHLCYAHNLFGSPYFETWTKTPGNLSVSHPRRVPVDEQTQFTVTVKTPITEPPTPLQYAKVCLNKPDDIYQVGSTDANGQVTFVITPQTTGIIKVTVTRLHNLDNYSQYRPSQTTCQVLYYPGGQQSSGSEEMLPTILCITAMPTILRNNMVIKFGVPSKGDITISVYDVTGSKVKSIKRNNLLPGYYQERIDTERLASGVYFVVLKQGDEKVSRKFLLVK